MRTLNSIRNIVIGVIAQFLMIIIGFAARSIFIKYFGIEYLGLNGLFSNILSILSFSELGFGTVALFSLYRPIAEKNERNVALLMKLYKKIYIAIFLFIAGGGLLFAPFIQIFIKDTPNIEYINFIFVLFAINSAISYLFSYKRSLLFADQKNYIASIVTIIFKFITFIVNTGIIIFTKNYVFYLGSSIILQFLENYLVAKYVDYNYPYLKQHTGTLDSPIKSELITKTKAAVFRKIGYIAVMSTDNLIISSFVGLGVLGKYSNYTMIITYLNTFIAILFTSIAGSIGNFSITQKDKDKQELFHSVLLMNFFIHGFCTLSMYFVFNDFIKIWIGAEFLLDEFTVFIICLNFYIHGMRKTVEIFNEANGNLEPGKYFPLLEAALNLIISLILAQFFGISGTLMGTIISMLLLPYLVEPYILHKYVLHCKPKKYYLKAILYFCFTICIGGVILFITNLNSIQNPFFKLFLNEVIVIIVFIFFNLAIFRKTRSFKMIIDRIKSLIFKEAKNV